MPSPPKNLSKPRSLAQHATVGAFVLLAVVLWCYRAPQSPTSTAPSNVTSTHCEAWVLDRSSDPIGPQARCHDATELAHCGPLAGGDSVIRHPDGRCEGTSQGMPAPTRLALGMRLSLNSSSASDLALLPGIGPKKAAAIINERQRQGSFADIADLQQVRGIGPKTVARLSPWLAVP